MNTMPPTLRNRLIAAALALAAGAGGIAYKANDQPSDAVVLAHTLGQHFESSNRHIGTPYVDKAGAGQPWTVCAGVTGPDVNPKRYYSRSDCNRLELKALRKAETIAKKSLAYWDSYNVWVKASFIDMAYNVPSALGPSMTITKLANAGRLDAACEQMPRWVYGTIRGVKTRLNGLIDRRGSSRELCAEWGRTGHFSERLIGANQ